MIKNLHGLILIYSIVDKNSFENINHWINQINNFIDISKFPIILVGNKKDLDDQRFVSEEEGRKIAEYYNFKFFETSTITKENIKETFQNLIEIIVNHFKSNNNNNDINNNNFNNIININKNNIHNNNHNNNKIDKEGKCIII